MPQFNSGDLVIDYVQYGIGPCVTLCFPGFGRDVRDFEIFVPHLMDDQRMVAFNLFFHGKSSFPESRVEVSPLQPEEWIIALESLLMTLGIDRFSLMGYSLGGRLAMITAQHLPHRIDSLVLLAPDGLKTNPFYWFACHTSSGRRLFKRIVRNPKPFFRIASILQTGHLLPVKIYHFVINQLDSQEKRDHVFLVWLTYRSLFPDRKKLGSLIRHNAFSFAMVFGKYDMVIRPFIGEKFAKEIQSDSGLHVLPSGHRLLTEETVNYLTEHSIWPVPKKK